MTKQGANYDLVLYTCTVVQIFDRLLASIGQDTLDSLFWLATEKKQHKSEHCQTLFYFVVAVLYVCILFIRLFDAVFLSLSILPIN